MHLYTSLLMLWCALDDLEIFVTKTCGHRGPSHSHLHMETVKNNALLILHKTYPITRILPFMTPGIGLIVTAMCMYLGYWIPCIGLGVMTLILAINYEKLISLYFMVCVVAWLHDVEVHKYLENNQNLHDSHRLEQFLHTFTGRYHHIVENSDYQYLFTPIKILAIIERISYSRQRKQGKDDWMENLGSAGILVRNIVSDADKMDAIGIKGLIRCRQYSVEILESEGKPITDHVLDSMVTKHYHEKLKILSTQYMHTAEGTRIAQILNQEMKDLLKITA